MEDFNRMAPNSSVLSLVDYLRRQNQVLRDALSAYSGRDPDQALEDFTLERDALPLLAEAARPALPSAQIRLL